MSIPLYPARRLPTPPNQATLRREAAEPMRFGPFPITETRSFPPPPQAECWVYVTLNAEVALQVQVDAGLQTLLRSPRARVSVDGQWIWWALQRKYGPRTVAKLSGSDLIHTLAAHCAREGRRLFLLGASPTSNAGAVHKLQQQWPQLSVAGYAMPHFAPGQEHLSRENSLAAVRAFAPDYVVLALGPAKQFGFAWALVPELDGLVSGLLCFGGSVDMVSGAVKRAPLAWQQSGLESIYRVLQQPSRLWRWFGTLRILPRLARGRF